MKEALNQVGARADELRSNVKTLLHAMRVVRAETQRWPPLLPFPELVSRVGVLADLCIDLTKADAEKFLLAPATRVLALSEQLRALAETVKVISEQLAPFPAWGGVSTFDAATGVLHAHNGNNLNLGNWVSDLQSRLDATLEPYLVITAAVKPRNIGSFGAAARALADKATEAAQLTADLEANRDRWLQLVEGAKEENARLGAMESEGQRHLVEIEKARTSSEEYVAKTSTASSTIEAVRAQAAKLESAVVNYQDTFDAFQNQLDAREEAISTGSEALANLRKELEGQKKTIAGLVTKAEEMLGGATTAGLSSAYDKRVTSIDGQLSNARRWYYGSIALLVASSAVALNLLKSCGIEFPSLPEFTNGTPTGAFAVQALSALGSRLLFILPALLLAGFAVRRHSALFRLREEYSHKYTAAASVQGFKIQAPSYEEAIAAAVFAELLKNPTSSLENHADQKEGNNFLDRLIMPRVEAALKSASLLDGEAGSSKP